MHAARVGGGAPRETPEKKDRKIGYRLAFGLVGLLLVVIVLTLPVAFSNLVSAIRNPSSDQYLAFTGTGDELADDYSDLNMEVIALDEVQRLLTLRVSGSRYCERSCDYKEKITLYSVSVDGRRAAGLPPSESLTLPANSMEFNTKFQLPISNDLMSYPFDTTRLILGITVDRIAPDNTVTRVPKSEADKEILATIQEHIPRVEMSQPTLVDPMTVRPTRVSNFDYLAVDAISFGRPTYLKVLSTLLALLITTAAAYAAFLRPFDQLILNAGALVLGVYGIRSLLLGSLPNDVTALDIYLTCVALFLLCTIAARGFNYLHLKTHWHLPGLMVEKAKTTRKCPYCKTDVEQEATRCPHCTSILEPAIVEAASSAPLTPAAPRSVPPGVPVPYVLSSAPSQSVFGAAVPSGSTPALPSRD